MEGDREEAIRQIWNPITHTPCLSKWYSINYIKNVLSVEEKSCQKFMGTHQHSVEKCCGGLTKQELMKKLKVVYERHTELMHLEMENWGL